jgi:phosphoglycerol transferase MdoB-like AlkP superfamily enzyme
MAFIKRLPRLLRWVISIVITWLLAMLLLRLVFYWQYNPVGKGFSGSAFTMGLRFDARVACGLGLLMLLLCTVKRINPFTNYAAAKFWNTFLTVLFVLQLFFYGADFYHYDYLHQRLNASVLGYAGDAAISMQMMWQSYPLLKILALFILLTLLAVFVFGRLLRHYQTVNTINQRTSVGIYAIVVLLFGLLLYGKISQFPLRWSDAFTLSDDFKANLALNPIQSFFSTLSFRNSKPDIKKVRAHYPEMAASFGVQKPDTATLHFNRQYNFADSTGSKTNVVLVICESFSAYKSSMWGNPLNTTPYFSELCSKGIFFSRCFTPAYGTARGVWATITGIPDVQAPQTASRNPAAVDQHTIINDFTAHEKLYFLGGDPTWANIQGLLANNIAGLNIYSQESFKAKKIDVWGISDKNLLLEANARLAAQDKPFFAIIQTADNHRPYTIPAEDRELFKLLQFSEDSLSKYGFESNDEMNAFRYTDFCFQQFIEAAKKEKYFANTLFVFVGDHGIRGNAAGMLPQSYTKQGLTCEHVPLLFYAPGFVQPQKITDVASQADILPSIASLLRIPYRNSAMGSNLFDTARVPRAFIIDHDEKTTGIITNDYYYRINSKSGNEELVYMLQNGAVPVNPQTGMLRSGFKRITDGYYETAKWLLVNNKKGSR